MKHLFRFIIIIGISFIGELLHALIPLPVPASIYGMVLMFAGLAAHIIPTESVRSAGRFLIEIMPVMFIPAVAGLMESWPLVRSMLVPLAVILIVSLFAVMGVSGRVTQAVIRREEKKKGAEK